MARVMSGKSLIDWLFLKCSSVTSQLSISLLLIVMTPDENCIITPSNTALYKHLTFRVPPTYYVYTTVCFITHETLVCCQWRWICWQVSNCADPAYTVLTKFFVTKTYHVRCFSTYCLLLVNNGLGDGTLTKQTLSLADIFQVGFRIVTSESFEKRPVAGYYNCYTFWVWWATGVETCFVG